MEDYESAYIKYVGNILIRNFAQFGHSCIRDEPNTYGLGCMCLYRTAEETVPIY